jgi:four helix bundle protein
MTTRFDHEKLDVYRLALGFVSWVAELLAEVKETARAKTTEVRAQLDRASLSSLLNIAEGNGKRRPKVKAKYFDDARGSCTECAACLDVLVATAVCKEQRVDEGKDMLVRIVSMLTKLVARFDRAAGQDR